MDNASRKIKTSLDKYSKLLQEVDEMKEALKKVDLDSFHVAHERMMDCLETVELSLDSDD